MAERSRRLLIGIGGGLVLAAAAGAAIHWQPHALGETQPRPAASARATPVRQRSHAPTATPVPLPLAPTLTQPGAPPVPLELRVPFVGGSWPVGVFVAGLQRQPAPGGDRSTLRVDLGVLNEAVQPLTIAAAGQYKEAVSLWTAGHWKGLFFVGFRSASGQDMLPSGGEGAADLPPGVWGRTQLEVDVDAAGPLPALRIGVIQQEMSAHPLDALRLDPAGQPWAAPGAAPTPVEMSTPSSRPSAQARAATFSA